MEQAVPFQPDNSEHGFSENAAVHLRCSQFAVDKDNRHFLYIRSAFVSGKFHFYLESIPFEADAVQIDGLQYLAAVAYKPAVVACMGNPVINRTYLEAK